MPPNVVELSKVFVFDFEERRRGSVPRSALDAEEWETIARFQLAMAKGECADVLAASECMERVRDSGELVDTFAHSRESWDVVSRQYESLAPSGASFLHYFWTHRFINIPTLGLLRAELPEARVYHAACTGYAGLLGAKAAYATGAPLILTEHGIYARERRVEIFNADWIQDPNPAAFLDRGREMNYFKDWWRNFFLALSRTAYTASDVITTMFEANRLVEINDGAPPDRTQIIPNAIDVSRYLPIRPRVRGERDVVRIALVGRVAPIKDIKTFLRALAILAGRGVEFEAFVLGPKDEDPQYVRECEEMVGAMGPGVRVEFPGKVNVADYYARMDIVALTSVSEGMPFVILEGNCSGLPVVATDVGACREMLTGRTPEQKAMGESGLLTPVATPEATASALERLARSPDLARRMGEVGRLRVSSFFNIRDIMNAYLDLYESRLYAGRVDKRPAQAACEPGLAR